MRTRVATHPTPDERQVPDLRAVPVPPVARMFPRSSVIDVLFAMRLEGGTFDTSPLKQVDWSARLSRQLGPIGCMLDEIAANTRDGIHRAAYAEYRVYDVLCGMFGGVRNDVAALRRELRELAPFADAVKVQVA